ncbi:hypothetical protein HT031_005569 [Scenedesmus sp. PABB004]|nr:hypothetical protein HT031_005569 [Scenedesmus sp. PABB004]
MTSNVLCKYFMNGACAYGDRCRFSHNRSDEPTQVCKFYLQGNCAYGDRCRYAHSKPSWSSRGQPAPPSNYVPPPGVHRPAAGPAPGAGSGSGGGGGAAPNWDDFLTPDEMDEFDAWQAEQDAAEAGPPARDAGAGGGGGGDDEGEVMDPADIPLCSEYAETGACSAGDDCLYVHGDACEVCGQHLLHPAQPAAAAAHAASCGALAASIAKRRRDGEIECAICLERVLSKPALSARRFGLLACDHPFCIGCIRAWRATDGADTKTALRTCPLCRVPTHFITPSTKWPDSPAEKEGIVGRYKAAMAAKDCANFAHGDGVCPFGSSCHYRHAYRDGRLEEVHLRRADNADGEVRVLAPVKLSSFLEGSALAQLALSRRPPAAQARGRSQAQQAQGGGGSSGNSRARGGAGCSAAGSSEQQQERQQREQEQEERPHRQQEQERRPEQTEQDEQQ